MQTSHNRPIFDAFIFDGFPEETVGYTSAKRHSIPQPCVPQEWIAPRTARALRATWQMCAGTKNSRPCVLVHGGVSRTDGKSSTQSSAGLAIPVEQAGNVPQPIVYEHSTGCSCFCCLELAPLLAAPLQGAPTGTGSHGPMGEPAPWCGVAHHRGV